jgi:hypothetical protein
MRERYVSFEPWWGGFSNVRMSYELICAISIITDRIIILPPKVHSCFLNSVWVKDSYLNIWEILDENSFKSNFNTIDYYLVDDYKSRENESSYFSNIEKIAKVISFDGKINTGTNREIGEHQVITNEIVNEQDLQKFLSGRDMFSIISEEKYLHFPRNLFGHFCSQVYGNTPKVRNLIKNRIKDGIKFKEGEYKKSRDAREVIGNYNSIHVRRNDFKSVHENEVREQETLLLKRIEEEFNTNLPIYIATDEKDRTIFNKISEKYQTYFTSDLFPDIDEIKGISIDQIMCTESDAFLGSKFSTFTNAINIQRGYLNKKDFSRKGINFDYGKLEYERFPWEIEKYSWEKIDRYFWESER